MSLVRRNQVGHQNQACAEHGPGINDNTVCRSMGGLQRTWVTASGNSSKDRGHGRSESIQDETGRLQCRIRDGAPPWFPPCPRLRSQSTPSPQGNLEGWPDQSPANGNGSLQMGWKDPRTYRQVDLLSSIYTKRIKTFLDFQRHMSWCFFEFN